MQTDLFPIEMRRTSPEIFFATDYTDYTDLI